MQKPGPLLVNLTRRLAETPPDFLEEPQAGELGRSLVAALVNDLLARYGARARFEQLTRFHGSEQKPERNRLALTRIAVWLLADDWFFKASIKPEQVLGVLDAAVAELASTAAAGKFAFDPERREELARVMLARLDYRPGDESESQARDRLSALSSSERRRLVAASRDAERRAREIREALVRQAAEESADKWTRE